jgi:hypothetical protein
MKCPDFRKLPFIPPLPLQILHRNETVSTVAVLIATRFAPSTMTSKEARIADAARPPRLGVGSIVGEAEVTPIV